MRFCGTSLLLRLGFLSLHRAGIGLLQLQHRRIHAIPQPCRFGAVIKHMPEVRSALGTLHFIPAHPVGTERMDQQELWTDFCSMRSALDGRKRNHRDIVSTIESKARLPQIPQRSGGATPQIGMGLRVVSLAVKTSGLFRVR